MPRVSNLTWNFLRVVKMNFSPTMAALIPGALLFKFILFIFACGGSLLLPGLSLIARSGGFSYCGAQALGPSGFSSCSTWAQ